jgi:very-short-patch-repair endonuclease
MFTKKSAELRAQYLSNLNHDASPSTHKFAQDLRKKTTEAEQKLWPLLRNRLLNRRKFRRQHALGPYIVDFYCHECKLVVELDGAVHRSSEAKQYDQERTRAINKMGITVIRFWNQEVIDDPAKVLRKIAKYLE